MKIKLTYIFSIILLMTGCKDSGQYTTVQSPESQVNNAHKTHKVLVKEIENAGMYMYVNVVENDKEFWIAIPETNLEIGQTYYFEGGSLMSNFKSEELNKTFEEVLFVEALRGHAEKNPNAKVVELIAQPEGGISIKEVLANTSALLNKEVIVKGKVVKINRNILDRNWVHLRDGTSFEGKSNLTFTTKDTVKVGDVVTFKGSVTLDKDFGHGYVYPILVENSELLD